jgi:hypothetical protein
MSNSCLTHYRVCDTVLAEEGRYGKAHGRVYGASAVPVRNCGDLLVLAVLLIPIDLSVVKSGVLLVAGLSFLAIGTLGPSRDSVARMLLSLYAVSLSVTMLVIGFVGLLVGVSLVTGLFWFGAGVVSLIVGLVGWLGVTAISLLGES